MSRGTSRNGSPPKDSRQSQRKREIVYNTTGENEMDRDLDLKPPSSQNHKKQVKIMQPRDIKINPARKLTPGKSLGDYGEGLDGTRDPFAASDRDGMNLKLESRGSQRSRGMTGYSDNDNPILKHDSGRMREYKDEEENIVCSRFPHLEFCACLPPCVQTLLESGPFEIFKGLYIGPIYTGYNTKKLLSLGVTHVLNVSCLEYTKRTKYFRYLNLDVFDTQDEDIKKHFRITNRFVSEALKSGGGVLIHGLNGTSRAPSFALAYLIGVEKITLKKGLEMIKQVCPAVDINQYFMKQLEQYDLEKLAFMNFKVPTSN